MAVRRVVVVDLEATCWERAEHDPSRMETIEIGAVSVELDGSLPWREFQTFVRPVREPLLSAYCIQLTSIRQDQVDAAEPFAPAFARFLAWAGPADELVFASWGSYDRRQFELDCSHHGVAYPFGERHANLKRLVCERLGIRPMGMARALAKANLPLEGTHHRGLDDARNIARLTAHVFAGDWHALVS